MSSDQESDRLWIQTALEEYKSLRTESLESMKGQQTTLRFGTATIAILISAGFNIWEQNSILPEIIFWVFNPILCYLIHIIWIGEVARMMRAGLYISKIEKKINSFIDNSESPLGWENWLRTEDKKHTPQLKWNYRAIIFLFLFIAMSSVIIGYYKHYSSFDFLKLNWPLYIFVAQIALGYIVTAYVYAQGKKFEKQKPA